MAERGEARREYQLAYYQAHKEELQKRHREYYWENKEEQRKRNRKHYLAHREKICKAALERYYKLKAERMEKGGGKTVTNKNKKFPRCPWCGAEMKADTGDVFITDNDGWVGRLSCDECGANSSFVYGKATKGEAVNALRELKPKKEQNRLLTLEEVREIAIGNGSYTHGDVCWLEQKKWKCGEWASIHNRIVYKYSCNEEEEKFDWLIIGSEDFDTITASEYGRTWRCWLRHPTNQEMTETPWEGEKDDDD